MFKFVHKKHIYHNRPEAKFVIYYSASDIVLGLLLIIIVTFLTINYIKYNIPQGQTAYYHSYSK